MRFMSALIMTALTTASAVKAQSPLLEGVKQNPNEAKEICTRFKALNSQGISAGSKESLEKFAQQKNLSSTDAEILSIYVIGLNCPDVF